MTLLIDIGNTRIKWATLTLDGITEQQAASYAAWDRSTLHTQMLSSLPKPQRVLIANVGGDAIARLVAEGIQAKWAIAPEFVHSTAHAAGVRCGYAVPENLGVDRWLGVIAAFHRQNGAACVASVGTAMTVDSIDVHGQHLGGIIVPGPDLAVASLLDKTADIATRAQTGELGSSIFAGNTLGAVHQGVAHQLAAVIERTVADLRERCGESCILLLAGGGSDRIAPFLRIAYRAVPDLVLQGLAVLARQ